MKFTLGLAAACSQLTGYPCSRKGHDTHDEILGAINVQQSDLAQKVQEGWGIKMLGATGGVGDDRSSTLGKMAIHCGRRRASTSGPRTDKEKRGGRSKTNYGSSAAVPAILTLNDFCLCRPA